MPSCRVCGVALDWHEGALGLCGECWDAQGDEDPYEWEVIDDPATIDGARGGDGGR